MQKKLRYVYLPYFLVAIAYILLYTFLHWLLVIQFRLFSVSASIINFGVPFMLVWIPIWIWLRPRIKLLDLVNSEGKDYYFFYQVIMWLAIAAPTIISQEYIEKATGKLTPLQNISEISGAEITKYYSVKDYFADKNTAGVYSEASVSGKRDENYNINIFVAVPLYASESEAGDSVVHAWLGLNYSDHTSNNISDSEKEAFYQSFARSTQDKFDADVFKNVSYFERVINDDNAESYQNALLQNPFGAASAKLVLKPVYTPFAERNGNSFAWIFISFGIGSVALLFMFLIPSFAEGQPGNFLKGKKFRDVEFDEIMDMLRPRANYMATPILAYLNVLVFLLMAFAGYGFISVKTDALIAWGADYGPLTRSGQWWRLFTSIFLHGGLMHVLSNIFGLFVVGIVLEPVLGKLKFILTYVLIGIIASATSLAWHPGEVSIGASGAIFGMYGIFLALLLTKAFPSGIRRMFLVYTVIYIGYNLLMGLTGSVDNAAHVGGLVSGFLIGFVLFPFIKKSGE